MRSIFNFRAFFQFLKQNKLYTAINIFGFSVSLMFVILLGCYSAQEFSTDQFHEKKDRIFLLSSDDGSNYASPIAKDIENRYPEIERTTRIATQTDIVEVGDKKISGKITMVDSTFFNIFSFPLTAGTPDEVLLGKSSAVLSESFARTLFGDTDPVGQTIEFKDQAFTVKGIFKDFRNTAVANADILIPYEQMALWWGEETLKTYDNSSFRIYLLTKPGTDLHPKLKDMADHFKTYYWLFDLGRRNTVELTPITDVYFKGGGKASGNKTLIAVLGSVALLILCFAVINYINLSVAQSGFRAREMATRRLLGSTRGQLFARLILESVLLCIFAFIIALLLASLAEPFFNKIMGSDIRLEEMATLPNIAAMSGLIILLGILAGMVPATVITNYQPIEVVKGNFARRSKMVYSKILISFQYLITIVLIGCSLTMSRQLKYMTHADLGYNRDAILKIDNVFDRKEIQLFKSELLKIPGVRSVALAGGTPFDGGNNSTTQYNDKSISFQQFVGDSAYFNMLGFTILKKNGETADPENTVWLNETALQEMELPDSATTVRFKGSKSDLFIAGIVKDFNFKNMSNKIGPAMIFIDKELDFAWCYLVKVDGNDLAGVYDRIEKMYSELTGNQPFMAKFGDEIIQQKYEKEARMLKIVGYLSLIAILISSLGILAMATFFIQQRSMEIAVRKVFGSTKGEILKRLIYNFIRLVVVAFVIAVPAIWYIMNRWLEGYAYRITVSWTVYLSAGTIALAIALLTITWQSWRAANANPAEKIKH